MALLSDNDREALTTEAEEKWSRVFESVGIGRQDLRAAINAVDQWVNDNRVSFNNALPQPAKANLTATQKAKLLMFVVRRRFELEA